ncbi:CHAD domain-containing protein [Ruminococcus sp. OA3]|uniref:CHAD domain-containing protein n=1 Tax=Ruminococcus sp. OA3 TaxID=2914164 RepID=UPI001F05F92B|nr:CHAD domain-containing protein [Ruminococcus sp. OA3]MCH1983065.1 CHAD domain-containing protein [Ruminococcus sp. OA3]
MQKRDRMLLYRRDYLKNRKSDVRFTSIKKVCSLFGGDAAHRESAARLAEELFRQNCPSFDELSKVAKAACMLEDIGTFVFDRKYGILEGDIILTHPVAELTGREQLYLAEALSALRLEQGKYSCRFLKNEKDRAVVMCIVKAVRDAKQQADSHLLNRTAADNVPCRIQKFIRNIMQEIKELTGPKTDYGDPEVIHDIRVAFRKLYSVTDVFAEMIRPEWTQRFDTLLKREITLLGKLRDLDVRQEKLAFLMKNNEKVPAEIPVFWEMLDRARAKALKRVERHCRSEEFQDFLDMLQKSADEPVCVPILVKTGQARLFRMKDVRQRYLCKCREDICAYREWLSGVYVPEPILHRLRLSFKKLRYVQEFFGDVSGREKKKKADECRWFQETLGELHDYAVLRNDIAVRMQEVRKTADKGELRILMQLRYSAGKEMEQLHRIFMKRWNQR